MTHFWHIFDTFVTHLWYIFYTFVTHFWHICDPQKTQARLKIRFLTLASGSGTDIQKTFDAFWRLRQGKNTFLTLASSSGTDIQKTFDAFWRLRQGLEQIPDDFLTLMTLASGYSDDFLTLLDACVRLLDASWRCVRLFLTLLDACVMLFRRFLDASWRLRQTSWRFLTLRQVILDASWRLRYVWRTRQPKPSVFLSSSNREFILKNWRSALVDAASGSGTDVFDASWRLRQVLEQKFDAASCIFCWRLRFKSVKIFTRVCMV